MRLKECGIVVRRRGRRTAMNFKRIAILSAFLALAACATPTPYQPADQQHGGYSDKRLAENRIRVTFEGNAATSRETVEDYLMLHAAEVTRDAGYSWFVFDNRNTETQTSYHTDFVGWPGWGPGFGWYWHSWPYDPLGGQAVTFQRTSYEAYAEVVLLTPEQAKRESHALNAADVIARLQPSATAPAQH
jgi:hypothetical protein